MNKAAEAAMMASEQPSEWADNRESGPEEAHHCLFLSLSNAMQSSSSSLLLVPFIHSHADALYGD